MTCCGKIKKFQQSDVVIEFEGIAGRTGLY